MIGFKNKYEEGLLNFYNGMKKGLILKDFLID